VSVFKKKSSKNYVVGNNIQKKRTPVLALGTEIT